MIAHSSTSSRRRGAIRVSYLTLLVTGCLASGVANGQAGPTNLVSVCSGVSLPPSAVTNTLAPVIEGVVTPLQDRSNLLLGVLGGTLPLTPPLSVDVTGLLAAAAAGYPVTLQALSVSGLVVGPTDRCDAQADSVVLTNPAGVAIGGNRIAGLGAAGQEAAAGTIDAVAIGNTATTDASAGAAVALGRGASVRAGATDSLALGSGATVTGANGVALGAGSIADRGPMVGSAGEVSVGAPGAERQITNVAAGTIATDAANTGQVQAVADQLATLGNNAVIYDGAARDTVTLAGAAGTRLTNVAPGAVATTSTDSINGAQLFATNTQVAANTNAIANIANGAAGLVRYSNSATPTVPNGGLASNDVTLVGAVAGPVGVHNVANGTIAAGSTDAVNGGQVYGLALTAANAVSYDANAAGARTNTVTLTGGDAAAPVRVTNVAAGTLAPGSTDAVNGTQLAATNAQVAQVQAVSANSVQYDPGRSAVTVNPGNAPAAIRNVAAGTTATDAANVSQLNNGLTATLGQANAYTDQRLEAVSYDLRRARRDGYRIADNKIASNADWDQEILRAEIEELVEIEARYDIEVTGFSTTEIDLLLDMSPTEAKLEEQPKLNHREIPGVEPGDLWILGSHKLLCGDFRDPASFDRLMELDLARMVFSDPPFNVKVDGHVGGLGRTKHAEFAMASGEMSESQFTSFLQTVFANAAEFSMDGAIHYQCMDWRHMGEMLGAGHAVYSGLQNLCTWVKDNGGMGSFYRSQHELVFVWKVGEAPHLNTVQLGKNGRYRTNVWNYRGATKTGPDAELALHPTVKPVTMIMDAIKDTSKRGEIVLDPFGGSGSTLIAAHKSGRRARLIEYEPNYCAITIRRWQKIARGKAVLEATGETFADVYARRNAELDRLAALALEDAA